MAFVEDLSAFFDVNGGFAIDVTFGSVRFAAIFDNGYEEVMAVQGTAPRLLCAAADVSDLAEGDSGRISGVEYVVREIKPDGTGLATVILERQ